MENIVLQVEGMSCGHCVGAIEGELRNLGVDGKVDLAAKTVTVTLNDSVSAEDVKNAIEEQGYDVV
ncbi:cation transporter [Bacillus manliponensis]|uniref:Copper resistance protein CopZ n=1 Tax=Bacillus manliponensis TaxID=574376 RepID=A0A073K099_9BACI|nr:cation transporter [Bacillus manliponensis]KEK17130.1 copper resistance protein CopZ [Bacillus manliponensis]KEK20754.1 copper resistance protein CopZ [Bacillus manliponensis]